jgi:outer membrane immunogenic protein
METSLNKEWMMMRKFLLGTVSAVALGGTAMAADLPSRQYAPPPPIIPIFTWTGFYVGVNAGYGWSTNNDNGIFVPGIGFTGGGDVSGFVGGGQIGYNYQFGAFVAGIEADIQWADLSRNNNNNVIFDGAGNAVFLGGGNNNSDTEWFGTVRPRLGYAFDRALVYITGGLAFTDNNAGWTIGGGLEYAFTNNLTAKVEGLYVSIDQGNNNSVFGLGVLNNGVCGPFNCFGGNNNNLEFGVVRAGLNYKF